MMIKIQNGKMYDWYKKYNYYHINQFPLGISLDIEFTYATTYKSYLRT